MKYDFRLGDLTKGGNMNNKVIGIVLNSAAALLAAYGLLVLAILGPGHWFNFAGLICGAALLLFNLLRKRINRLNKAIKIVCGLVILICLLFFCIFEFKAIGTAVSAAPAEDAEWMIVLGAKVNGAYPSLEFAHRLDLAADYAKDKDIRIILTGGQGYDEAYPESEVALKYLLGKGIPKDRLYYENKSTSTSENFRFAKEIIGASDASDKPVIVVSSSFHLYRAGILAEREGYGNLSFLGSIGRPELLPQYYAREFAAYVRECIL